MSKILIIAILVAVMAIGGTAFAEYGPGGGFLGVLAQSVLGENGQDGEENGDEDGEDERSETAEAVHRVLTADPDAPEGPGLSPGDEGFGQAVSENARAGGSDFGRSVSEAARNNNGGDEQNGEENGDEDGEEERSETAEAVHRALTADPDDPEDPGLSPGDEGFGEAVSENARAGGPDFGQSVSEAARNNNGSSNAGSKGNSAGNGGGSANAGSKGNSAGTGGGKP